MTFTQLRTFALVAELGSLRAAAAALGVSEPAVSAGISSLRADLGDALFVRAGGALVPARRRGRRPFRPPGQRLHPPPRRRRAGGGGPRAGPARRPHPPRR